jgi:hypothetical protein
MTNGPAFIFVGLRRYVWLMFSLDDCAGPFAHTYNSVPQTFLERLLFLDDCLEHLPHTIFYSVLDFLIISFVIRKS